MLIKFTIVNLLMAFVCHTSLAIPLDMSNIDSEVETIDSENVENVFYEIKELKRMTRQCPFSGGMGGVGGGANGQAPDIQQMILLARTVLNALDSSGVGGGLGGTDVDTNQLSRLRRRG